MSLFGYTQNNLSNLLDKYNEKTIPYISINELHKTKKNIILLDAREQEEYNISHLKDAIFVGYNNFNLDSIHKKSFKKDSEIVVYCSLGIRSEEVAKKIKKAGYTNVKNLYGGIFEWKNNNLPIYNSNQKETDSIHAFSKKWGKWLKKGVKIYE